MAVYAGPNTITVDLPANAGCHITGPDYLTYGQRRDIGRRSEAGGYVDFLDALFGTWMASPHTKWNVEKVEGEYLKINPDTIADLHSDDSQAVIDRLLQEFYPAQERTVDLVVQECRDALKGLPADDVQAVLDELANVERAPAGDDESAEGE